MTVAIDCIHPAVYGPGPREGLCTRCGEFDPNPNKPAWRVEVERLIRRDDRIPAVRAYRAAHPGAGLIEVMGAVDAIANEIGHKLPHLVGWPV